MEGPVRGVGASGVGGARFEMPRDGDRACGWNLGLGSSGQRRCGGPARVWGEAGARLPSLRLLGLGPRTSQQGSQELLGISRWLAGGSESSSLPAVPSTPLPTTHSWSPRLPWLCGAGSWCFCLWAQGCVSHRSLRPREQPLPPNGRFLGRLWVSVPGSGGAGRHLFPASVHTAPSPPPGPQRPL